MFGICGCLGGFLKRRNTSTGDRESRKIIVLGSLGVGKSSLVNMLVGKAVAPVSSGIGVAHPPIVEYSIPFSEISGDVTLSLRGAECNLVLDIYDTVGLEHRPSPWNRIKTRLKHGGGVDVVVYCMRRGRLSKEQVADLDTIWKAFCRGGNVPLILAVNDIDYRHGSTEQWWEENGENLRNAVQVRFADHICLNTWDPFHPSWGRQGAKYGETQKLVRDLVIRHCKSHLSAT